MRTLNGGAVLVQRPGWQLYRVRDATFCDHLSANRAKRGGDGDVARTGTNTATVGACVHGR